MEINTKNESLAVCSCVCRTKNSFTAECDVIVPDSKPDILKVLQLSARTKTYATETKNGRVTVTGTVCFNILYLADDEEKSVKSITSSCDFSNVFQNSAIQDSMLTFTDVDISDLSCNIANCRKLTLCASLCMHLQVYSCKNVDLISDIEGACTKTKELSSSVICAHAQSTSTLTDSFSLGTGKAPIIEILKSDGSVTESDIKIIDDKAIIKGNVRITVLYKSETGIEYAQSEVPFAHIVQVDSIREDMDTEYRVKLTSLDVTASENSEGQTCILDFSVDFSFRVIARCTYSSKCVTDAFVPRGAIDCQYTPISVDSIETIIRRDVEIREKITLPDNLPPISSVYQVILRPFMENCSQDGEILRASGYAEVYILYLSHDNDAPVYSYKTNIDFSCTSPSPGCMLTPVSDCIMRNVSYTISSDNSVDVRSVIDVTMQCIRTTQTEAVCSAKECDYTPEKRPSIIVSFVSDGHSLWDIAKKYRVSPDSILSANALTSEDDLDKNAALIIPK